MSQPSILIVGAGAMGMACGYQLSCAGVAVTYLVRPEQLERTRAPQLLYCYDDGELKNYSEYRATAEIGAVAGQSFDYVLVTLDGAACRSSTGVDLLRELGQAIMKTSAHLIIGGVGIGLREHYLHATGLPEGRIMQGMLGSLSYQVARASLPVHPPTDATKLAQASVAYHHFPNRVGFYIVARPSNRAREFAAIYNLCNTSRCVVIKPNLYEIMGKAFFPLFAVCELGGWRGTEALATDRQLWSLCCQGQNEVISLPEHGWLGRLMRLFMTEKRHLKLLRKLERESLPLDFHAFNQFHHGRKVRAQDIQVMRDCVAEGESCGHPMPALKEILLRLDGSSASPVLATG